MRSKPGIIGVCAMELPIALVLLSVFGCILAGQGSNTRHGGSEVKNAAEARGIALNYLRKHNVQNAPTANIVWQEQDGTPPQWVGGVFNEFISDEWIVKVFYPVVSLGNTVYQVVVFNIKLDCHWKGTLQFGCTVSQLSTFKQISEEESRQIGLNFLKKSPTFAFDSVNGRVALARVEPVSYPYRWGLVNKFKCVHLGYGDCSRQILVIAH
ncbi:hypothetical protein ACFLT8_00345 [Chloroflexota bacterium]